jgi:MoaA/NifB/PqqE/SkfB family radical SAM enzyme
MGAPVSKRRTKTNGPLGFEIFGAMAFLCTDLHRMESAQAKEIVGNRPYNNVEVEFVKKPAAAVGERQAVGTSNVTRDLIQRMKGALAAIVFPRLDWIQVEVTSHCNAACIYCPRTVYRDLWVDRHLAQETFERLAPALGKVVHVHLQGWGEPFLHPRFFEMAAAAKRAGCRVGTTTNATLLDGALAERIVDSGIDVVGISLAGVDAQGNDRIRKGAPLGKVMDGVAALVRAKEAAGASRPEIHMAYMLLASRMDDLERIPAFLEGLGVAQVVISTLDYVADRALSHEVISPGETQAGQAIRRRLDAVVAQGRARGLHVHYHLSVPGERRPCCTENVQRALVVASDGTVTPCVYTDLEIPGAFSWRRGEGRPYHRLAMGNVNQEPLHVIWGKAAYGRFRRSFSRGPLSPPCESCPKLYGR